MNPEAVWAEGAPESLIVLWGGPVGAELAQFFHRDGREGQQSSRRDDRIFLNVDREAVRG